MKRKAPDSNDSPLRNAFDKGEYDVVTALVKAGAEFKDSTFQDASLLQHSLSLDTTALTLALIEAGADIEEEFDDTSMGTPLTYAIKKGNIAVVKALLKKGVKKEGHNEETPLYLAISEQQTAIAILLINDGANIKANISGFTKPPLIRAIDKGNTDVALALIHAGADLEDSRPLGRAILEKNTTVALALIKAGADPNFSYTFASWGAKETLLDLALKNELTDVAVALIQAGAKIKGAPWKKVQKIIPLIKILDIPLGKIVNDPDFFYSIEKVEKLLNSGNPISVLRAYSVSSPVKIQALKILDIEDQIKEHEASLSNYKEAAMRDKEVLRAHQHFQNTVKPYFKNKFLSYSESTDDYNKEKECLENIEKEIRLLILQEILNNAKEQHHQNIFDYVSKNLEKLTAADVDAMKESAQILTANDQAQAAWRCYNPFAPVVNPKHFPNLLTKPTKNMFVYSSETVYQNSDVGDIPIEIASMNVRERAAYYYLAATDPNDGDDSIRQTRIANFRGKLAEIRHTHGFNDTSCYPGHFTRFAQMGAWHSVAQLPNTREQVISEYFCSKALDVFATKMKAVSTKKEKYMLLHAIIDLTKDTAKNIILNQVDYAEKWLSIRQDFIDFLGSDASIFSAIKNQHPNILDKDDLIYITQHSVDLAREKIGPALRKYYLQNTDRKPGSEDKQNINPFPGVKKTHHIFDLLLQKIVNIMPKYDNSLYQLKGLAEILQSRIPVILQTPQHHLKGALQSLIDALKEDDPEKKEITNAEIVEQLYLLVLPLIEAEKQQSFANPFTEKLNRLSKTITLNLQEATRKSLEKNLQTLKKKNNCFISFIPLVCDAFQGVNLREGIIERLTEVIVNHYVFNGNNIIMSDFYNKELDELKHDELFNIIKDNPLRLQRLEQQIQGIIEVEPNVKPLRFYINEGKLEEQAEMAIVKKVRYSNDIN